jgi:hypothetical protein
MMGMTVFAAGLLMTWLLPAPAGLLSLAQADWHPLVEHFNYFW